MHIYDEILERLRNEYEKGATYKEIAKEKNISYSYLRGIINGVNPPEKLSLELLFKIFPHATINLSGDSVKISNNNGTAFGVINGNVQNSFGHSISSEYIIKTIIEDTIISSDEKIELLAKFAKKCVMEKETISK